MDFANAVMCIVFSTFAVSYGWGMRGALIGGEKGAMLPGALIGLVLGWFSGLGTIGTAAAGLIGMTFGGTETYGETIGFVLHRGKEDYNPKKGYAGLSLKGGLWFAICGGFIGISLSYGVYSDSDIYIFCLLIPVMQLVGYWLNNTPYNPAKNKFPKRYFSRTRREEWGGNLLMLIAMAMMADLRDDYFTLIMMAGGFVFGAIGWVVAMRAYVAAVYPLKNGKYLFGKLYHKGLIDGWKLMEFILGAFGGFGLSLAFCLGYDFIEAYREKASYEGAEFVSEYVSGWIPVFCTVCILGILAVNATAFICDRRGKSLNSFVTDHVERPLYNVIPLMFVLAGDGFSARVMTAFMLIFVCILKCLFDHYINKKILALNLALTAVLLIFAENIMRATTPFLIVLAGTVPYLAAELIYTFYRQTKNGKTVRDILTKTSFATVYPCLAVMSAVLIAVSYKIFGF